MANIKVSFFHNQKLTAKTVQAVMTGIYIVSTVAAILDMHIAQLSKLIVREWSEKVLQRSDRYCRM